MPRFLGRCFNLCLAACLAATFCPPLAAGANAQEVAPAQEREPAESQPPQSDPTQPDPNPAQPPQPNPAGAQALAPGPEPIVIDEAPARLSNVQPRLWTPFFSADSTRLATVGGFKAHRQIPGAQNEPQEPGELAVWDLSTRREQFVLRVEEPLRAGSFSPDGKRILLGDTAGNLRLIELATGRTIWNTQPHADQVSCVAFLDAATIVSAGYDGEIQVRDLNTAKLQQQFRVPGDMITGLSVASSAGLIAAATFSGKIIVWDIASGDTRHTIEGHSLTAEGLAFSPDGKQMVTTGWDKIVSFWDVENAVAITPAEGHAVRVFEGAWSADGKIVATSDEQGNVFLWDGAANRLGNLKPFNSRSGLAFSPDSKFMAITGYNERTMRLFDAQTRQQVREFRSTIKR